MADDIRANVTLDLSKWKKYERIINKQMRSGSGEVGEAFQQWAVRYRSFTQLRYAKFSRGGGDWSPLSSKTKRKRGKTAAASILRDTNTIFNAFTPVFSGVPGQLQQNISFGIRVGVGGSSRHPDGLRTIGEIVSYHQEGAGRNPKREIVVIPPERVIALMRKDLKRALDKIADRTG